ncbi:MAG: hypothetical protein EBR82_15640 [Caulobacteraceae bacterium]|nr:hypothetical protein [Caulobacteraceae bacterium]
MADGALTITVGDQTLAELAARAEELGVPPDALVSMMLDEWVAGDRVWIGDAPSDLDDEVSEEGARDWSEVRPEFVALIEKTFGPAE